MAEKKFLLSENQRIWNQYYNGSLEKWTEDNKALANDVFEKEFSKKKMSLAQYKPVVLSFEQYVKKPFSNITVVDIEEFSKQTEKQSKLNHLNAFLLAGITNGSIATNNLELLIGLLPEAYRKLGRMIAAV